MFIIKGSQEQIQYAQQLIYEKITGIQGSQPPHGYFNDPNAQMSPGHSAYGQQTGTPGYGQQQQQYMAYQQGQQGVQQGQADQQAAWAAYYQQYYGAAGQPAAAAAATGAAQTPAAGATAATAAQPTVNPSTGQADYSQAWVEYYRSLGMHEQAEAILKQSSQGAAAVPQANGTAAAATTATPAQQPQQAYNGAEAKQNGGAYGGAQGQSNGVYGQGQQAGGGYGGANGGYGAQSGSYNGNGYNREASRH